MISVPRMPVSPHAGWENLDALFASAATLSLSPLRAEDADGFFGATVRVAWNDDGLWIWARMTESLVRTAATADQQRLWELGDVFEIFLRDETRDDYLELHVAPSGHTLKLRFPSALVIEQMRDGHVDFADVLAPEVDFQAAARIETGEWEVLARVGRNNWGAGQLLRGAFCRYDYGNPGEPPVLSSTAPFRVVNFHRQEDWGTFRLEPPR